MVWKRLHTPEGELRLVNLDSIAWIDPIKSGGSAVVIAGYRGHNGEVQVCNVRESPEEVLAAPGITSK